MYSFNGQSTIWDVKKIVENTHLFVNIIYIHVEYFYLIWKVDIFIWVLILSDLTQRPRKNLKLKKSIHIYSTVYLRETQNISLFVCIYKFFYHLRKPFCELKTSDFPVRKTQIQIHKTHTQNSRLEAEVKSI